MSEASGSVSAELHAGIVAPDAAGRPIRYRFLSPADDLNAITAMLHDAYRPLAEAGFRYLATHQDVEVTRKRVGRGDTIVAELDGRVVGIVTMGRPGTGWGAAHYQRPEVARFGQYAVEPSLQRAGIGLQLLAFVEALARECGARHLALDTSEGASGLIAFYGKRGFEYVETVQWETTNYRSVVLSKPLP
jgi:GNAT superfamily N-acetyltransferase